MSLHIFFREEMLQTNHNCGRDAVPGPEVPRIVLEKRIQAATNVLEATEYNKLLVALLDGRKAMISKTVDIINEITKNETTTEEIMRSSDIELTQFDCHKEVAEKFHNKCYNLGCNDFALRQINHFAVICEVGYDQKDILESIEKNCQSNDSICGIH